MATISLYILTFNCARNLIDVDAFASQLFSGLTKPQLPDLLVLSLQEIAPVPLSFIGGSFLVPYFARFHNVVQKAAEKAADSTDAPIYTAVVARNLGMTGIMVFGKDPDKIQDLETGGVGVGLWEMGNKGGLGVRFTYGNGSASTELTFVAAHLAPMEDALERRNEDWKSICRRLVFSSTSQERTGHATSLSSRGEDMPLLSVSAQNASIYKATSHLFLAGDLNYRTSTIPPSSSDHAKNFPQPNQDPSSPKSISTLFQHDTLTQERVAGRTCHGLIETPVTFPPTYKYESKGPFLTPDEDLVEWHWAKHRWPSWCDRILYLQTPARLQQDQPRTKIAIHKYMALPLFPTSDHRAVALEATVPLVPIPPSDSEEENDPRVHPPFNVDINWKQRRERARMLELLAGFTTYLTTTWEGGSVLIALAVGTIGGYFVLKSLIDF